MFGLVWQSDKHIQRLGERWRATVMLSRDHSQVLYMRTEICLEKSTECQLESIFYLVWTAATGRLLCSLSCSQ